MQNIKTSIQSLRFAFVFALLAVLCFFVPVTSQALTLTPPRMEISGNPGETVTAPMTLINEFSTSATYYSSFANFEAQGDSGTPALTEANDDLGTWITVPDSVTIAPGGSRDITVSVTIPKTAAPGGHFAAIFWGTQPNNVSSNQVGIGAKTGVLVLLRVNGEIPEAGGVTEFDTVGNKRFYKALPVDFYYRFQNGGGDRIKPVGTVYVKNLLYITSKRLPGNPVEGNVLPQSTRRFETTWEGRDGANGTVPSGFFAAAKYEFRNFGFGHYGAHLKLEYGTQGEKAHEVVRFWVFPWELIVLVLGILLIVYFLLKAAVHHYNNWVIGKAEELLEKKEAEEELRTGVPHHHSHHDTDVHQGENGGTRPQA